MNEEEKYRRMYHLFRSSLDALNTWFTEQALATFPRVDILRYQYHQCTGIRKGISVSEKIPLEDAFFEIDVVNTTDVADRFKFVIIGRKLQRGLILPTRDLRLSLATLEIFGTHYMSSDRYNAEYLPEEIKRNVTDPVWQTVQRLREKEN